MCFKNLCTSIFLSLIYMGSILSKNSIASCPFTSGKFGYLHCTIRHDFPTPKMYIYLNFGFIHPKFGSTLICLTKTAKNPEETHWVASHNHKINQHRMWALPWPKPIVENCLMWATLQFDTVTPHYLLLQANFFRQYSEIAQCGIARSMRSVYKQTKMKSRQSQTVAMGQVQWDWPICL